MIDTEYIEQNAYNQGYRRGFREGFNQGRTEAAAEFEVVLNERMAVLKTEVRAIIRRSGAEIAKTVREAMNDGDRKERDGDE